MTPIFSASDALGYHRFDQLEKKFLELDQRNPADKRVADEEIKNRVSTTFYGKNITNFFGYFPYVASIQAIFKMALFIFLDVKLNRELKEIGDTSPDRKRVIEEIKEFHKWEKIRTAIEFFSFMGTGLLLLSLDIAFTINRNLPNQSLITV